MTQLKLITAPTVRVVGRQQVDGGALLDFLGDHDILWERDPRAGGPESLVEVAGRLCYMSFAKPRPGGNAAYISHLLEAAHGSCLEHAVWNFLIYGVSRTLTHELVRHRAGFGYSQLSQRYVDCADVAFVVPPAMLSWHADWASWHEASAAGECDLDARPDFPGCERFDGWAECRRSDLREYAELTERLSAEAPADLPATDRRKWARQAARSVLPGCAETKLFATANARAIRHFVELRGSRHADAEIRRLAVAVLRAVRAEAPAMFGDYEEVPLGDGTVEVVTKYRKV